jgi:hypothetical protein
MPEHLIKVITRTVTAEGISMWGTLHLNAEGGKLAGWLCDSWTTSREPGTVVLLPRLHWLNKEDDKFHRVRLDIPVVGSASITLGPVDEEIEPRRDRFMREFLAQWENEYLSENRVQIS